VNKFNAFCLKKQRGVIEFQMYIVCWRVQRDIELALFDYFATLPKLNC
jgi:hypothetical protein